MNNIKTQTLKNIISEWLEERELPSMNKRNLQSIDLQNLTSVIAILCPGRAGITNRLG